MNADWIVTKEMADDLGISRPTLLKIKGEGYVREGFHYRKKNPTAPRSNLLWHRHRTREKFGRF